MKRTTIVNIFGAPGSGKSTCCSYLFSRFKMDGIDCELVTEFAKDMVWQGRKDIFSNPENQFYIGANQFFRMNTVVGKVDVAITDSPILLSALYNSSDVLGEKYNEVVVSLQKKLNGINVLLNRTQPYQQNRRNETVEEANKLHLRIEELLDKSGISYTNVNSCAENFEMLYSKIKSGLNSFPF